MAGDRWTLGRPTGLTHGAPAWARRKASSQRPSSPREKGAWRMWTGAGQAHRNLLFPEKLQLQRPPRCFSLGCHIGRQGKAVEREPGQLGCPAGQKCTKFLPAEENFRPGKMGLPPFTLSINCDNMLNNQRGPPWGLDHPAQRRADHGPPAGIYMKCSYRRLDEASLRSMTLRPQQGFLVSG